MKNAKIINLLHIYPSIFVIIIGCNITNSDKQVTSKEQSDIQDLSYDSEDNIIYKIRGNKINSDVIFNDLYNLPPEILQAALNGVDRWRETILHFHGKDIAGDIDGKTIYNISLGLPLKLYRTASYSNNIEKRDEFAIQVFVNGTIVCWMNLAHVQGIWEAVGIGGAENALLVEKLLTYNYYENRLPVAILETGPTSPSFIVFDADNEDIQNAIFINQEEFISQLSENVNTHLDGIDISAVKNIIRFTRNIEEEKENK
jgi:hypothetical protein